jgi:hypothetical protein
LVRAGPGADGGRLTRGLLAAGAVALVTVAGVSVLVVVFARSWWRNEGGRYTPQTVLAAADITPESSLFGDVLTARVDVLVDPRKVDPGSIELTPDFRQYAIKSESRRVEGDVGHGTTVEFFYAIQCITAPCVALTAQQAKAATVTNAVRLPPVKLTGRSRDGRAVSESITWPPFVVHSRLSIQEIGLSTPKIEPTFIPPRLSWRVTPDLIGAGLLSGAVLLVLGAGWLGASTLLGDTRRFRVRRIPSNLTAVERALRLAEHARKTGELDEERKALERLAVELGRMGRGDLARQAGRLAWSEDEPAPDSVTELVDAVRTDGAG